MDVGRNIKKFRKMTGLTQAELGKKIGRSLPTVQKYESGCISINIDTLDNIAKSLGVYPLVLLDDEYKPRGKIYLVYTREIYNNDKELEIITSNENTAIEWVNNYNEEQQELHNKLEKLHEKRRGYRKKHLLEELDEVFEINKKINKISWALSACKAWYEVHEVE